MNVFQSRERRNVTNGKGIGFRIICSVGDGFGCCPAGFVMGCKKTEPKLFEKKKGEYLIKNIASYIVKRRE